MFLKKCNVMIVLYKSVRINMFSVLFLYLIGVVQCNLCSKENVTENEENSLLVGLLNTAENALHNAKQYVRNERSSANDLSSMKPMDCAEIYEKNTSSASGIYEVWPRSRIISGPLTVYCDMHDDGGRWTVIQRRGDFDSGKEYFYRNWESYKTGFGNVLKDFWIGNDNIYVLTNQRSCAVKFYLTDWEGNVTYATYDEFWMDGEAHLYTMHVAGYRGTAGDSFSSTNGIPFTTNDKDNDKHAQNCAVLFKGAWWYTSCHGSNLNGLYLKGPHVSYADGVEWSSFRGAYYSLKDTVIKIRPKNLLTAVKSDVTPH